MSFSTRYLCTACLIFVFAVPAHGETFQAHVNSYCEGVQKPNRRPDAEFTKEIVRLAKEKQVILEPKLLTRYPSLVYLVVLMNELPWKSQETLDDVHQLDANGRVNLCKKLEMERLKKWARELDKLKRTHPVNLPKR